jgi:hypothetical protein
MGLKILTLAMEKPICGEDVTEKSINQAVKFFMPMLTEKIGELNFRARNYSLDAIGAMFRNPKTDVKILIENIMDITDPDKGPSPDKAPWRIVLARLEIFLHHFKEFGTNNQWSWKVIFKDLICPSLFN